MEAEGDQISEFLLQLEHLDPELVLYQKENFPGSIALYPVPKETLRDSFLRIANFVAESGKRVLQGRDLPGVKHYSFADLSEFTDNDAAKKYLIGKMFNGRFLKAKVVLDSGIQKDVAIKTFDLFDPPQPGVIMSRQPLRLHNEIMLLMNKLESHPILPRLIGYSIDKRLVVVYDLKPGKTLADALKDDELEWVARLKFAIQVARLVQYFHDKKIRIGSIDTRNILTNEWGDMKLCEFGLITRLPGTGMPDPPNFPPNRQKVPYYASGTYITPELYNPEGDWTVKADIWALGELLLELITRERSRHHDLYSWAFEMLDSGKTSLVDTSFLSDVDGTGSKITELVMSCMRMNPLDRPHAGTVADELQRLSGVELDRENKKPRLGSP